MTLIQDLDGIDLLFKATMRQVVERLPGIELAAPPVRLTSDFVHGIKQMPVTW